MNHNEDNTNHDPEASDSPNDDILARLKHVENRIREQNRPWYRIPSNLISILAVVATVAIFATTYLSNQVETQFQRAQQFSQVLDEISALVSEEIEIYRNDMPPIMRTNASVMIANRRAALISKADRLLNNLKDNEVSKLDLVLLAPAYMSIGRYDDAEKILKNFARDETVQPALKAMAWRSLISLYSNLGPERIDDAKEAAKQGLNLIKDEDNNILIQAMSVTIHTWLASYLMIVRSYEDALRNLLAAERDAWAMPCTPNRLELLKLVKTELAKVLSYYPEGQNAIDESRNTYDQPCPNDQAIFATALATQNGVTSALDYVGDYKSEFGAVNVRENAEGVLKVTIGDKQVLTFVSIGNDIFSVKSTVGFYLAFERDGAGQVTGALFLQPNGVFSVNRN